MRFRLGKGQFIPLLIFIMFLWALVMPLSKAIVDNVSPIMLTVLRNVLGAGAIFAFILFKKYKITIEKKDIFPLAIIGAIGTGLGPLLMFIGVSLSTATNASILVNTNPIFVALLAPLLIAETVGKREMIGILVSFIGMLLVTTNGLGISQLIESEFFIGNIALIGAAICIMIYTVYGKKYIEKYGGINATLFTVAAGALFMIIYAFFTNGFQDISKYGTIEWAGILYIGIVVTALVYSLWYKSIKVIGAAKASSFKLLIPVFATATAIMILGENPSITILAGGALVVAGLALMQERL